MFNCNREDIENKIVISELINNHPAWIRLNSQLRWYDDKSVSSQRWYKGLKVLQIVLAVGIPVVTHLEVVNTKWLVSFAGALIAVLEGIQQMNQYSTLWVTYRSTAERLKHEKFLFLATAGSYRDMDIASMLVLLAERVEEHVSTEHANWVNETRKAAMPAKGKEKHE